VLTKILRLKLRSDHIIIRPLWATRIIACSFELFYWWVSLSTVRLLALTTLGQLHFDIKENIHFFTKQATLMRRSTLLSLPLQLVNSGRVPTRSNAWCLVQLTSSIS